MPAASPLPRRSVTGLAASLAIGLASLGVAPALQAQTWPSGPIEMVVPFPPGGSFDAVARTFARLMETKVKQPVVVQAKPGGSFVIGLSSVQAAPANGQSFYYGPVTPVTVHPHWMKTLPFAKDSFVPVCQTFENTFVLVAGPESRYNRFSDVVAASKAAAVSYAHPGVSSSPHLAAAELFGKAGAPAVDIPYKGEPAIQQELTGKQIELAIVTAATVADFPAAKSLVVFADRRLPNLPNTPTAKELGFNVTPSGYGGVFVRAGTPPAVVRQLESTCKDVLAEPELQDLVKRFSQRAEFLDSKAFGARIDADHASKAELLKTVKLDR
jgi:tripartite-type tricarboxylate transporter receptor subunit TctC